MNVQNDKDHVHDSNTCKNCYTKVSNTDTVSRQLTASHHKKPLQDETQVLHHIDTSNSANMPVNVNDNVNKGDDVVIIDDNCAEDTDSVNE